MNDFVQRLVKSRIDELAFAIEHATQRRNAAAHDLAAADVDLQTLNSELTELNEFISSSMKKLRPAGHWLALNVDDYSTDRMYVAASEGIGGVQRRLYWRDIESKPGDYSEGLDIIRNDLRECERLGIPGYMVQILYKSFDGSNPLPGYLSAEAAYYETTNPESKLVKGFIMPWWSSDGYIVDRFIGMCEAIGAEFDSDMIFKGIATQETADSLNSVYGRLAGYDAVRSRRGIQSIAVGVAKSIPNSYAMIYMNYITGMNEYLSDIASQVHNECANTMFGGPDILPNDVGLNRWMYPQMKSVSSDIPVFMCMQNTSIRADKHEEYVRFAKDLGVKLIIWNDTHWLSDDKARLDRALQLIADDIDWSLSMTYDRAI